MSSECPFCGDNTRPLYRLKIGENSFLHRCERCFGCHSCPPISQEVLTRFYKTSYFSSASFDHQKASLLAPDYYQKMSRANALPRKGAAVIEIGPGYGYFSKLVQSKNEIHLSVCEPGDSCREYIGQTIKTESCFSSVEDALKSGHTFDFIYCFHTVEHVPDVRQFLTQLSQMLSTGGRICILTPNGGASAFRLFGRFWGWAAPDQHISFLASQMPESFYAECGLSLRYLETVTPSYVHYPSRIVSTVNVIGTTIRRLSNFWSAAGNFGDRVAAKIDREVSRFLSTNAPDSQSRKIESYFLRGGRNKRDELLLILEKAASQEKGS